MHPQKQAKPNLLTEVQEMKAELAAIRESIGSQHRTATQDQNGFRNEERARPRRCADCLREGFGERCTHCFIWRMSGHFSSIAGDHEPKLGIFPGKQTGIAPLEQEVTLNMQKQSRTRVKCGRIESVTSRHVCCSQCHASWYYSKLCQQEHWGEYKILCEALREVETTNQSSAKGEEELIMSFPAHLTSPQHSKLTLSW